MITASGLPFKGEEVKTSTCLKARSCVICLSFPLIFFDNIRNFPGRGAEEVLFSG
jgi:hypothetical protein